MPTSTAGNWNNESGFTLIELTVVVLLLGLFSMLVVPRLPAVGEDGLKSSARRIAGTAKYFFNESALSGRPHRLVYNLDEGTFRVRRIEEDGEVVELSGTGREQRLRGNARFKDIAVPARGEKRRLQQVVTANAREAFLRHKLKPEYQGLAGEQIRDIRLSGQEVTEEQRKPILAYLGDTAPPSLDNCPAMYEARILICEMTFVSPEHRKDKIHKFGHMHLDDFVERSRWGEIAGTGFADWPITYADLEPYYTNAEWDLGVSGQAGANPFDPPRSRPYPLPPLPVKSSGVLFERGARKLGWHPFPAPMAILSRAMGDRSACVHCGFCQEFAARWEPSRAPSRPSFRRRNGRGGARSAPSHTSTGSRPTARVA